MPKLPLCLCLNQLRAFTTLLARVQTEMQLRVLSVRDGREWLVPLHDDHQWQVQVADIKRLALQQQQVDHGAMHQKRQQRKAPSDERKSEDNDENEEEEDDESSDAFVMFRGRILADMDFVNLHSLTASDFFVLTHEAQDNTGDEVHSMAEDRDVVSSSVDNEGKVQQLVDMGFPVDRVQRVMQHAGFDMARSIAILTGDEDIESTFVPIGASTDEASELLIRAHPQLQVLQPVLGELQKLGVDQTAARDSLQAILLLKQHVSNESLAQLNANPAAAIQFFRLPPPRRQQQNVEGSMQMRKRKRRESEPKQESASELIDLVDDPPAASEQQLHGDGDASNETAATEDADAIARLASMGFDRELVTAMYESCGRHEESALNALCSLLD